MLIFQGINYPENWERIDTLVSKFKNQTDVINSIDSWQDVFKVGNYSIYKIKKSSVRDVSTDNIYFTWHLRIGENPRIPRPP